jgi:hypothetical protein
MSQAMTEEQRDRCPDIVTVVRSMLPVFKNALREPIVLRCEKPAGHRGVHEAEGIEWWDSK